MFFSVVFSTDVKKREVRRWAKRKMTRKKQRWHHVMSRVFVAVPLMILYIDADIERDRNEISMGRSPMGAPRSRMRLLRACDPQTQDTFDNLPSTERTTDRDAKSAHVLHLGSTSTLLFPPQTCREAAEKFWQAATL